TDDFAHLCKYVWNLTEAVDRLVAVYRVLEPHLVSTYVYHADATDPLTDTPTVRLLRHLAGLGQSHIAWGQAVLESLTKSKEDRRRAIEVQSDIEARLVECGGVTGQGIESHWLAFHSAKEEKAKPRVKRGRGGYKYRKVCPPVDHPIVEEPFWFSGNREDFRVYEAEDPWSIEGFRHKFHQLLYGEVETTDRMGKMIAEYPDLPWEMRMELAHQMWDEARHIEIVAKAVEEQLGGELGYGPWSLLWWWMQNDPDPLKRLTVTNSWAEANLMHTLREWRTEAEKRGYTRIAELSDYLQADERTHVKLATDWIRELTKDNPSRREELVTWGRQAVQRMEAFWGNGNRKQTDPSTVQFTFLRAGEPAPAGFPREEMIGE
ncbi:MAG TPA: ferritin-like domain-containing protein, partial [Thermomicrobiales bacterium]|nr:ferritin-like domain-containing protein [Thermomicrobiales bacterium]